MFVALTICLTSGLARADASSIGTPEGEPGDEVEFSIAVTAGTTFYSIDIVPPYESFASVLILLDFKESSTLTAGGDGLCIDDYGQCAFFYVEGKSFPQQSILATLRFRVTDEAYEFVDANGQIPLDLGVFVGTDLLQSPGYVPLPEGQVFGAFTVQAVPSHRVIG